MTIVHRFPRTTTGDLQGAAPATGGLLQRKCACGQHTAGEGECEECRKKKQGLQRRRGWPGARRSAIHRRRPPSRFPGRPHGSAGVLRAPARTRPRGSPAPPRIPQSRRRWRSASPEISMSGKRTRSRRVLGLELSGEAGPRHDLSRVRIHTGEPAEQSAREVNALAFTVGQDIVFRNGLYNPGSAGRQEPAGARAGAHRATVAWAGPRAWAAQAARSPAQDLAGRLPGLGRLPDRKNSRLLTGRISLREAGGNVFTCTIQWRPMACYCCAITNSLMTCRGRDAGHSHWHDGIATGYRPFETAINSRTNRAYVTDEQTSEILVIDGTSHAVVSRISVLPTLPPPGGNLLLDPVIRHIAVSERLNRIYLPRTQEDLSTHTYSLVRRRF